MIRKGLGKGLGTGYKNLAPMDSHIHSLSAKGVKSQALMMTKKAYADINMDFEKSTKIRDLKWGGTPFVSIEELKPSLEFVENYNEFDGKMIYSYLKTYFPDLKYKFGRESSPVIYVKGDKKRLKELQKLAPNLLKVDEDGFNKMTISPNYYGGREKLKYQSEKNNPKWSGTKDELRLWWD